MSTTLFAVSTLLSLAKSQSISCGTDNTVCQNYVHANNLPWVQLCNSGTCGRVQCDPVGTTACPQNGLCEADSSGTFYCARNCVDFPDRCDDDPRYICNDVTKDCETQACSSPADCPDTTVWLCGQGFCVQKCSAFDYCDTDEICTSAGTCNRVSCSLNADCVTPLGSEYLCDLEIGKCALGCFGNDTLCEDPDVPYSNELVCSLDTDLCDRVTCSNSVECAELGLVCDEFEGECISPCTTDADCVSRFGSTGRRSCNTDSGLCTAWCDPALPANGGIDACIQTWSMIKLEVYCDTQDTMGCQRSSCSTDADCTLDGAECYDTGSFTSCSVPCVDDADCNGRMPANSTTVRFCGMTGFCIDAEQACSTNDDCVDREQICNQAGYCEYILCHGDDPDALCQSAFGNDLAMCADAAIFGTNFCMDNQCLVDSDCTGKFNACAYFTAPMDCYTTCTEDADCAAAYGLDGIPCQVLPANTTGNGVPAQDVYFCDVFNVTNSSYLGTFNPTAAPTTEPSAEPTMEPTASPSAEPTVEPTASPTTVEPTTAEPTTTTADEATTTQMVEETDTTAANGAARYGILCVGAVMLMVYTWM